MRLTEASQKLHADYLNLFFMRNLNKTVRSWIQILSTHYPLGCNDFKNVVDDNPEMEQTFILIHVLWILKLRIWCWFRSVEKFEEKLTRKHLEDCNFRNGFEISNEFCVFLYFLAFLRKKIICHINILWKLWRHTCGEQLNTTTF